MTFTTANILDAVLIAVLIATVVHYVRRGFAAGILELVGGVASLALAWLASQKLSPAVFDNFFKSGLITKTANTIQQQGSVNLSTILDGLYNILPQSFIDKILASAATTLDSSAPDIAEKIVENIIAPLVVPIISVVVFFAVFAVCRVLITFLTAALNNVNKLPVVGGTNRLLGVLLGAVGGSLNVVLLLCLVWGIVAITGGSLPFFNETTLSGSWFYAAFSQYNPFL